MGINTYLVTFQKRFAAIEENLHSLHNPYIPFNVIKLNMRSERGQTSIELILVVGAVILITISVYPAIKSQTELNKGVTTARDGATYAANMMGLGFTKSGSGIMQANKTIKIVGMTYSKGTAVGGLTPVAISFEIQGTNDATVGQEIADHSLKVIYHVFNGNYGINDSATYVDSESYRFTVNYTFA